MPIELRQPQAADVPELGRICYEAFKDISDRHGFPTDFASVEFAQGIVGLLTQQEAIHSVAAFDGDAARGSNFLGMFDEVGSIGPISVDVTAQGDGIGRMLMEDALSHAAGSGLDMVRLCQDAFNMRSLALYASLGFDVVEPLALLELSDEGPVDANVRPAAQDDIPAMADLCQSVYRVSRRVETEFILSLGFPTYVLDRGRIVGYLIGGVTGHGVAESDDDLLALLNSVGASVPNAESFITLRNGDLYRKALAAAHRNRKTMNLMAHGRYEEPQGPYCPSVFY
jgi:predicted N-acetyltransferase YhbS